MRGNMRAMFWRKEMSFYDCAVNSRQKIGRKLGAADRGGGTG